MINNYKLPGGGEEILDPDKDDKPPIPENDN